MPLGKNHPIDLNCQYPCPCRRKGILLPIILTEAMGCDRCQQIFVVAEKDGYIEQLNPTYPYKKRWRWNGKRWISTKKPWQENYFLWGVICLSFFILISTPILMTLNIGINLIFVTIISLILILLSLSIWFAFRR
ncbi:hypothetical protein GM3708_924 [Geminocystis sp. NIES-3708]|uniref:hypothetical protein n=1 Tax=Geminocystis sp. NIES-3708 TaxID=1615909 RepID=UPI0005FC498F|nr:hypothetical protein [Geminocystis sp. NIES-3708]BAQ60518.1 hypothetical protein GM3708_924 [Geminocystis sp. NIES-3708]